MIEQFQMIILLMCLKWLNSLVGKHKASHYLIILFEERHQAITKHFNGSPPGIQSWSVKVSTKSVYHWRQPITDKCWNMTFQTNLLAFKEQQCFQINFMFEHKPLIFLLFKGAAITKSKPCFSMVQQKNSSLIINILSLPNCTIASLINSQFIKFSDCNKKYHFETSIPLYFAQIIWIIWRDKKSLSRDSSSSWKHSLWHWKIFLQLMSEMTNLSPSN